MRKNRGRIHSSIAVAYGIPVHIVPGEHCGPEVAAPAAPADRQEPVLGGYAAFREGRHQQENVLPSGNVVSAVSAAMEEAACNSGIRNVVSGPEKAVLSRGVFSPEEAPGPVGAELAGVRALPLDPGSIVGSPGKKPRGSSGSEDRAHWLEAAEQSFQNNYPSERGGRRLLSVGRDRQYVGGVDALGRPQGDGVLILGDGSQHVGKFVVLFLSWDFFF